jgi:7-cyano-7-deazaguanosine (preQ0) biosynthesis protein QueE
VDTELDLVVSEVFGPTVQGEGPSLGMRAGFVRLGRCNLACSFCDTAYTWDWTKFDPAVELHHRTAADVAAEIRAMDVPLVVLTGGEPLLQQSRLIDLLTELKADHRIEIETAGTIAPTEALVAFVDQFNVSPKLANSGNPLDQRYKPKVLRAFEATGKAVFKFVALAPSDLDEVQTIVDECRLDQVWVMPEGTNVDTVMARGRELIDAVNARGWNLTTRLHILLWGDKRGV